MVTDGKHTYGGEHFPMDLIDESQRCTPETKITLYIDDTSI